MKILVLFAVLVIIGGMFLAALSKGGKGATRAGAYRRRKLMTDNELEFFGRLVAGLPDHYIFPQVAVSALIEAASSDKKLAHGDRLKVAQQRVDYVVCTTAGEVVAVIELDDRTHSSAKDQLRDSRLEQAGIRTVRFQSRAKPTPAAIRVAVCGQAPAVVPAAEETAAAR
jgi:hypothetical protein